MSSVIDLFVLTEISISSAATDLFSLPGYAGPFYTRCSGQGGGIAVFVSENWSISNISLTFTNAEYVALSLGNAISSICLLAVYRPPSANIGSFLEEFETCIRDLSLHDQLCIVGDFNIDTLSTTKSTVCSYLNILASYGIECTINSPTREELLLDRLVSSCIDHINIRTSLSVVKAAVVQEKLADHYFVACQCSFGPSSSRQLTSHVKITTIDSRAFDQLVSAFDWNTFLESVSYKDVYEKFVRVFNEFYEECQRVHGVHKET